MTDTTETELRERIGQCCSDNPNPCTNCILDRDALDKFERLEDLLKDCNQDFNTLYAMFIKMRSDRDLWKETAENLAGELGKKEYANAEYANCKEAAQGVAW